MGVETAVNIEDLRDMALRVLPKALGEMIVGAAEDRIVMNKSVAAFRQKEFVHRILKGVVEPDQATTLFGREYSTFFGIAPTGMIGVLRKDIEKSLALAAGQAGVPVIVSGASTLPFEAISAVASGNAWAQLYASTNPDVTADLVRRAEHAGAAALVWTVDLPVPAKADGMVRRGVGFPLRISLADKLEALAHLTWMREYLSGGMVAMGNYQKYSKSKDWKDVLSFYAAQRSPSMTWRDLETLRRHWKGPLIVKGLLHPADAIRCADLGADGVIVSNHGGFAVDREPASIDMLPLVAEAVGTRLVVMLDSGVRRGSDIIAARCLGAQFVFVGRATLWGATAGLTTGAARAIDILKDEIRRTMSHVGCADPRQLTPEMLYPRSL